MALYAEHFEDVPIMLQVPQPHQDCRVGGHDVSDLVIKSIKGETSKAFKTGQPHFDNPCSK
uniref:Uncharacterized protein n=1 Tax=uncultured bacterium eBACred22E04 TaxID=334274 RepID=Q4PJ44_9BACT|nr:hypothetical protein [uncultured bacterium eBACred22E04]